MPHTINALLPVLQYAAGPTGSGVLAYLILSWLIQKWPVIRQYPRRLRIVSILLAALIGVVAQLLIAGLTGADVLHTTDLALAAALSWIVSQCAHLVEFPAERV